jgi:hypothetical protein
VTGLAPAIHVFDIALVEEVDGRDKRDHDG